jgi:hypothetical protein
LYQTRPELSDLATYIRGQEQPAGGHVERKLVNPKFYLINTTIFAWFVYLTIEFITCPLLSIQSPSSEDIVVDHPLQLALTVGNLGVGFMDSTAFLPSSWSNSTIDGSHILFGIVDF